MGGALSFNIYIYNGEIKKRGVKKKRRSYNSFSLMGGAFSQAMNEIYAQNGDSAARDQMHRAPLTITP